MAIIDIKLTAERHKALMTAFSDPAFREELKRIEAELKKWLTGWVDKMEPLDERIKNVYSIESRVKGIATFEEKLDRKNYIYEWTVSDDTQENQRYIKRELTDLIGLRINCHFTDYEKIIFDYFVSTAETQYEAGFTFNFKENKIQKNGNIIYKFSGLYKGEYHFEVQIKSLIHNVWGEVEHKTVYKNPTYDGFYEQKNFISKTLHDVMMASDRELYTLFKMSETETQLLRSIFFIRTCEVVAQKCRTKVLGSHYNSYFKAFTDIEPIKKFVICALSGTPFVKEQKVVQVNGFYDNLCIRVIETFPAFYLECLYNIDCELNIHQDYRSFLIYFLQQVIDVDTDDFEEGYKEGFNDQDENQATADPIHDYLAQIDELLGTDIIKEEENKEN